MKLSHYEIVFKKKCEINIILMVTGQSVCSYFAHSFRPSAKSNKEVQTTINDQKSRSVIGEDCITTLYNMENLLLNHVLYE